MAFDPCGHASFQDVKISTGNARNFIGSNVTMRGTAKEASTRASEHRKMDNRFSLSESEPRFFLRNVGIGIFLCGKFLFCVDFE